MNELLHGARLLLNGFGWWAVRPRVMATALIPAAIVAALIAAGLVTLGAFLPSIVEALTPWADTWAAFWAGAVRVLIGTAVLAAGVVVSVTTFTALTLLIGEPFYDRVWRSVEERRAGEVPEARYGLVRAAGDAVSLIARGLAIAVVSVALGFVPVAGAVLAAVAGASLSGWVLADELTTRALSARGLDGPARRALRRASRGRVWGFGVATHLLLMIPLAAIVTMPAAVAGSTLLAHELIERGVRPASAQD